MINYKYFHSDNKVVALSTFAQKTVKGTAKCNPEDTFSLEAGKALAAARCNSKVAAKRAKWAKSKLDEAHANFEAAQEQLKLMMEYYSDALVRYDEAEREEHELLERLAK